MLSSWLGKLAFKKLMSSKYVLALLGIGLVFSVGYFGWQYINDINQKHLVVEIENKRLSEMLDVKTAESDQMLNAVNAYSIALVDTSSELDRVKKDHAKLEGQFNAVQFAKHFEQWAMDDTDRLAVCMQSSFNQLLDNLEASTRGQIPTHEDPLSCATVNNSGNRSAVVAKAGD